MMRTDTCRFATKKIQTDVCKAEFDKWGNESIKNWSVFRFHYTSKNIDDAKAHMQWLFRSGLSQQRSAVPKWSSPPCEGYICGPDKENTSHRCPGPAIICCYTAEIWITILLRQSQCRRARERNKIHRSVIWWVGRFIYLFEVDMTPISTSTDRFSRKSNGNPVSYSCQSLFDLGCLSILPPKQNQRTKRKSKSIYVGSIDWIVSVKLYPTDYIVVSFGFNCVCFSSLLFELLWCCIFPSIWRFSLKNKIKRND